MIKLVARFCDNGSDDINYIKIAASAAAYPLGKAIMLWRTGDTYILKCDGFVTISGDDFDGEELKNFLSVIGATGVSLSVSAAEKLGYPYEVYHVLKSVTGSAIPADFDASTDEIYSILKCGEDGDITLPERTAFMADLSHRIRHGTALAVVYKGTACVIPYISKGGALICGVSAGQSRGQGFAGLCVAAAVKKAGKPCFTVCREALIPFYKKYGFSEAGKIAEIIF